MSGEFAWAQTDPTAPSRDAFAKCAAQAIKKYKSFPGLTPAGKAYLVGFTCSNARDQYRQALIQFEPGIDPDQTLTLADSEIIQIILNDQ